MSRRYFVNTSKLDFEKFQLCVLCDVRLKWYGSVANIRDPFSCETAFIMSKTRVAPLKKIFLPRLELLGVQTVARMANYLGELFKITGKKFFVLVILKLFFIWFREVPAVGNLLNLIVYMELKIVLLHCKGNFRKELKILLMLLLVVVQHLNS